MSWILCVKHVPELAATLLSVGTFTLSIHILIGA